MMRTPRWPGVVVVVSMLLSLVLSTGATVGRSAGVQIGSGAAFMPAGSALYFAIDLDPDSEQTRLFDRLTAPYLDAPEVHDAQRELGQDLGLGPFGEELLAQLRPTLAGEVFVGVGSVQSWRS